MDELFVQVLERFTERLIARQREMYAADPPVHREVAHGVALPGGGPRRGLLEDLDGASGAVLEPPGPAPAVARVNAEWRAVLREAFQRAAEEYGLAEDEFPVEALVALTMTFGQGYALERLEGIDEGHAELLDWIERWLERLENTEEDMTIDADRRPPQRRSRQARSHAHEQSRARYPDEEGFIERDGVRVFWESYGEGEQTILFLPTWTLVHSRVWKAQIPYFARHFRVICFDPRGNGRSDRPQEPGGLRRGASSPRTRST